MNTLCDAGLAPGLEAACGGFAAPLRARVTAALGCVLGDGPLGGGSRLTGDGFRLELAFGTTGSEARWTADPAVPEEPHIAPIVAARRALLRLGTDPEPAVELAQLGLGQEFAWVGGRQGTRGDAWKLYCDIPHEAAADVLHARWALPRPALVPAAQARMAALDLATGKGEIYYRTTIYAQQLEALLRPCCMADRAELLRQRIGHERGRALDDSLPGGSVGISYAERGGHLVPTLYLFARALWGADAAVRRRWLGRGDVAAESKSAYRIATAGMAERRAPPPRHAMVGFHLDREGIALSLGVRPEPLP